ncbi:MAG: magnesium transporter [Clostridiales bacterium]|nr:magnesium transporter [Clostridiales bacterium]
MQTNLFSLFKNRIPWLLILMIAATFTGLIVQQYESLLTAFFALIVAIPLLTGSGGNAGLQSSATIIRGLTLGEIKSKDYLRVMAKEVALALLCGVALAGVNFARMFFISKEALPLCFAVSVALVSAVLIAKIIGCALPMLAKRAGLKPALVSNTMLTTLIDACTLAVYFALAKVILTVA